MSKKHPFVGLAVGLLLTVSYLAHSQVQPVSDAQLVDLSRETGFRYFKDNPARLPAPPRNSVHGAFDRVRFNSTAQSALGPDGKLPEHSTFPPGSLIVKESFQDDTASATALSIMLKAPNDPNASEGWVWGEYRADGTPTSSVTTKGQNCVACHGLTASQSPIAGDTGNRDHVRTFGVR